MSFTYAISYDYSINNSSLKVLFTQKGDEIIQKDVNSHAPILDTQHISIEDGIEVIGESAFAEYSKMISISLGYGINLIRKKAFYRCSSLKCIVFPNSLQSLEANVFDECTSLENVTINPLLTNIESNSAFHYTNSLSYFFIPYGNNVFSTSSDNTILIIDNSTAFVGPGAFQVVNIPDNIEKISKYFLYGRPNVVSINFSTCGNLKYIDSTSFSYSSISEFIFPEGVKTIGSNIFEGNRLSVKKIVIPSTVIQVGNIFSGVKEIIIHENCTAVHQTKDGTIYNSDYSIILLLPSNLVQYEIPKTVKSLNFNQIRGISTLSNLTVEKNHSVYSDYLNGLYNTAKTILHTIPGGITSISIAPECQTIGQAALSLPTINNIIFEGRNITNFNAQSFQTISNMEKLEIPDGVTFIGEWAFYSNKTPNITFPSTLTTLSSQSFSEAGIKHADLSKCKHLNTIPESCFISCISLESLLFPECLESISVNAFSGCKSLGSVTITKNVHTLESSCFKDCTNLIYLDIQSTVPLSICSNAFSKCGLINITVGKGTSVLYQNAFSNNPNIEEISFDDCMLSEVQTEVFAGCSNLKKLRFGSNLSMVYPGAFSQMDGLKDILVSETNNHYCSIDGVLYSADEETLVAFPGGRAECEVRQQTKFIGEKAFYKCRLLKDLKFSSKAILEEIYGYTFAGCSNLTSIELPASLRSISEYGFEGCTSLLNITFIGESNMITLKKNTFSGCLMLETVAFEQKAKLQTIESSVFQAFKNLKTFACSSMLRKIESDAFAGCFKLENINLTNVEEFGERCFQGCHSLCHISFSPNLRALSEDSFRDCMSLQMIIYCGNNNFIQTSFSNIQVPVKVKIDYQYDKFGGLSTWRLLDGDCNVGTQQFTFLLDRSISFSVLGELSLSGLDESLVSDKNVV